MKKSTVIGLGLLILLTTITFQQKIVISKFNLKEINTQPGMNSLSLVTEIAKFKGLTFENLVEKILLDASINK